MSTVNNMSTAIRNATATSDPIYRHALLLCINLPLLADLVRKYVVASISVLVVADCLAALMVLWILTKSRLEGLGGYWLIFVAYVVWGGLTAALTHASLPLAGVGLRPLLVPLLYMTIAYVFFQLPRSEKLYLASVFFWIVAIGGIALMQILLGREHPINDLPEGIGDEFAGIGDYDAGSLSVEEFFRPTSIFFHTAKFGQAIFFLTLVVTVFALLTKHFRGPFTALVVFSWVAMFISGQRAAVVFLVVTLISIFLFRRKQGKSKFLFAAIFGLIFFGLGTLISDDIRVLVFERSASGFTGGIDRVAASLNSAMNILSEYGLYGEGLGFFTFGSQYFGGEVLYAFSRTFGDAENGWLRIVSETGLLGMTIIAALFVRVCGRAIIAIRTQMLPPNAIWYAWLALSCALSLAAWSFAHDIFGNPLTMSLFFISVGAFESVMQRHSNNRRWEPT